MVAMDAPYDGREEPPMSETVHAESPNIIPAIRYQDAMAAIDWLERAFGFERGLVVAGEDGVVHHAQLSLGPGWIMLGSSREDELGLRSPRELGGVNQSIYVIVADPDAHYARAKSAGAEIVRELADTDYGSREYTCRDPEGHLWSFGTYRPSRES
jgi:uncharacterized glyoxalase superfamily protein PhnB